jgi:hypothetical protein
MPSEFAFLPNIRYCARNKIQGKIMLKQLVIIFIYLFCLTALNAHAKDGEIYKSSQGHWFVNGGISTEEAERIRHTAKNYSLQVLFTLGNAGAWIADARLMILDGTGNTMFTKSVAGPLLYINLPAGDYQIIGRYNGVRQSKRITLTEEKPQRVILNWADESEEYSINSKNDTEQ